jgi:hypothetical protein
MPKVKGGLDILDLKKFNRALRLRWHGLKWKDPHKPWSSMPVCLNDTETALFRACISIVVGNDKQINFWNDRWLDGQRPKDIALMMFKLAWRKNLLLAKAMQNRQWMRGLQRLTTTEEAYQFGLE